MKKITKSVVLAALSALLVFGCKNSAGGGGKDTDNPIIFDATGMDLNLVFWYDSSEDSYWSSYGVTSLLDSLPKKNQEVRGDVKFSLSSNNVTGVSGRLEFFDSAEKKLGAGVKVPLSYSQDGTVSGRIAGIAPDDGVAYVNVCVYVKLDETVKGSGSVAGDNGDGMTSSGKYISVQGVSGGIKITLAKNISFGEYGSIAVDGIPCQIEISPDDVEVNRKEYIFPFAESGKTYYVSVDCTISEDGGKTYKHLKESVKCVAGGGWDYNAYIYDAPLYQSKLEINYDDNDVEFNGLFTADFSSAEDIIKKIAAFESFKLEFSVLLGESDWSNTVWWAWTHALDWGSTDLLEDDGLAKPTDKEGFIFVSGDTRKPSEEEWAKYNYKYAASMTPKFTLTQYDDTIFKLPSMWSEVKKYTRN